MPKQHEKDAREITVRVINIKNETSRIRRIELESVNTPLPSWEPGAHINVILPDGDKRSYSLINFDPQQAFSSAPDRYVLGVQLEADSEGGSKYMHHLSVGDTIRIHPPSNSFALEDKGDHVVLVAGGIGVTPLISMASALRQAGRDFSFHYAARTRASAAFLAELREQFEPFLSEHYDDEPDNAFSVSTLVGKYSNQTPLYICGPKAMISAVKEAAYEAGWAEKDIHFELFATPKAEGDDREFVVELASTGETFVVPVGKSILEVLEAAGHDLLFDCQRGDCGACKTTVVSGAIDHRDLVLTDDEKAAQNVMQICVSRAKSDRLVLDI